MHRKILRPKQYTLVAALSPASGGPATTTFNPADKGTLITLSGGNLTVTGGSSSNPNAGMVRSIASHSTGKFYNEFTITADTGFGFGCGVGVANATQTLNGTDSTRLGNTINGICAYSSSSDVFFNGTNVGSCASFSTGNTVGMAVDLGAQLFWITDDGTTWNAGGSANPATGVGGYSFSGVTGAVFAAIDMSADSTAGVGTANFGGSSYLFLTPVGFGNW